jgi:hypothetical protein
MPELRQCCQSWARKVFQWVKEYSVDCNAREQGNNVTKYRVSDAIDIALAIVPVQEEADIVKNSCNNDMSNDNFWPFQMPLAVYEYNLMGE